MSPVRAERKRGADWATRAYVRLIEPRLSKMLPGGLAFWARWEDIGGVINKTKQTKQNQCVIVVACMGYNAAACNWQHQAAAE